MASAASGARIAPVHEPSPEQSELLSKTLLSEQGRPLNVFTTLAHSPQLLKRFNALGGFFLRHGRLPARERELVILRVAARTGSEYEHAQHRVLGAQVGLSGGEIERTRGPLRGWDDADRALLEFVDEMIDSDGAAVPTWDTMADRFEHDQLIELTLLIGFYRMLAGFLLAVGVDLEDELRSAAD
jgi:4-carboxymuconolactone decarboxylase